MSPLQMACEENLNSLFTTLVIGSLVVMLLLSAPSVAAVDIRYFQLQGKGNSMYPTIHEGQWITVQMPVAIESIEVGDIIVYGSIAALAYMPKPDSMWIGHRVVEKYQQNGQWWFRTKGDNNPDIDPWEVPSYWVTGLVVNINQTSPLAAPQQPSVESLQPQTITPQTPAVGLEVILPVLGGLALVAIVVTTTHRRDQQRLMILRNANVHSCFTCRHYRKQYNQRLASVNGILQIQRTLALSRGICQHLRCEIADFPRTQCEHYDPQTASELCWNRD